MSMGGVAKMPLVTVGLHNRITVRSLWAKIPEVTQWALTCQWLDRARGTLASHMQFDEWNEHVSYGCSFAAPQRTSKR